MSAVVEFNAQMYVSEQLNRQLINATQDVTERCIEFLAAKFNFDAAEAKQLIGLNMIKMERKSLGKAKVEKPEKNTEPKPAFPLPYNGECNENLCFALRQNSGLFTQCSGVRKNGDFCKKCASQMQKTGAETPEFGTIQQRMAVGIFEYVDPKGRKPIAYTKVMKKCKITEEQVIAEASKFNMTINPEHFTMFEESKRGRPKSDKAPKEKGAKGRPKKTQIILETDDDDLITDEAAKVNFKDLVRETIENSNTEELVPKKKGKTEEEKEAERLAKEAEKKAKEEKKLAEKAEKEAKLAEKAEKEAKLAAEKAEKEAKKKADEEAKAAKKAADEAEKQAKKEAAEKAKADKIAAKEAAKAAKAAKGAKSPPKEVEPVQETAEPEVLRKIVFEDKKYLKSKSSGICYDYENYKNTGELDAVGKWSEATNRIIFDDAQESEEEDDDEEEQEEEYSI